MVDIQHRARAYFEFARATLRAMPLYYGCLVGGSFNSDPFVAAVKEVAVGLALILEHYDGRLLVGDGGVSTRKYSVDRDSNVPALVVATDWNEGRLSGPGATIYAEPYRQLMVDIQPLLSKAWVATDGRVEVDVPLEVGAYSKPDPGGTVDLGGRVGPRGDVPM